MAMSEQKYGAKRLHKIQIYDTGSSLDELDTY